MGSKGQTGWEYIEKAKHNVGAAARETSKTSPQSQSVNKKPDGTHNEEEEEDVVQALENKEAIQRILGIADGGSSGEAGYLNRRSGWADAGGAMRETRKRVTALARVQSRGDLWKRGQASRLLFA